YFNCTCPSGTTGLRCNEKVSEPTDEIEYRLSAAATAGIAVGVVVGVGASVSLAVFAVHRASGRSRFSLCCCSKQQSHAAYNNEGGNFDDNSACKTNGGLGSGSAHHQDQQISPSDAANCSTVICHNGGTCNNYTENPPCLCPLPYIAPNCESAADYCFTLQPDKNITELPKICPTAQQQLAESGPDFGRTLKSDGSLDGGLSPGPSQQNDSYQHSNPQFA
uniref:EGF-like domain-containing protein n=1 Tax=Macrostomum lignano TaxID=282301 RepID=A0A1I8GHP0_9PLAT